MTEESTPAADMQETANWNQSTIEIADHDGTVYVLLQDGHIRRLLDGNTASVYISPEKAPKGYDVIEKRFSIKFWQMDKNALPIWYDSASKTVQRIVAD